MARGEDGSAGEQMERCLRLMLDVGDPQHTLSPAEIKRFRAMVSRKRKGLIDKMERYNAIRHDDGLDEEEKEAIREELFDGDHACPHL